MAKIATQKINKEKENLINQLDPTDIYRTLYPKTAYTFFSRDISRTDHIRPQINSQKS